MVPEISAVELSEKLASGNAPVLLDVREPEETEVSMLAGSKLIPLAELPSRYQELDPEADIVVICRGGGRSEKATMFLKALGYGNVSNLVGGMKGYRDAIDPNMPVA
jgi:rhodanese-related sulfurtransferase